MRWYQVATAATLIAIAAVAMIDTRAGALPDASGGAPGGLKAGWYPFWSATLAAIALAITAYRSATTPQTGTLFEGRTGVMNMLALLVPMVALVILMDRLLGFYMSAALYVAWFTRAIGRYRWIWVVVPAIAMPVILYLTFENFFKVSLPKSIWYVQGLLPF